MFNCFDNLQDKYDSKDNLDDMHADNYDLLVPCVCLCYQRNPLSCNCSSWYLLRRAIFHSDSHCFGAFWFERLRSIEQLHGFGEPTWCISFLCSSSRTYIRQWGSKTTRCRPHCFKCCMHGSKLFQANLFDSGWCVCCGNHLQHYLDRKN